MKIWFDSKDVIKNKFCSEQLIITPFLPTSYILTNPSFSNIQDYIDKIASKIILSDITDCDYILYPNKFGSSYEITKYIELSKQHNKKLLAFYNDDNETPIANIPNLVVFRTSILRSKQKPYEYALPAWSLDFKYYGTIPLRIKRDKPTVGFCGFIEHSESNIRRECIKLLSSSNKLNTNFIIRRQFWGGKIDDINIRKEYVKNMIESDYILCTRGSGNFSYRFYETLSSGRIPIFIDTDCVIPFENDINAIFPIINENGVGNLEEIILDFWNKIENYEELQHKLRLLYEEYYSPYGFINQLDKMKL